MNKEVEIYVEGAMNVWKEARIDMTEVLDEDELEDIRVGGVPIEAYMDKINAYIDDGGVSGIGVDAELTDYDLLLDGDDLCCVIVSDYPYNKYITVTEDMTAKDFTDMIHGDLDNNVKDVNIVWADTEVLSADLHYPAGDYTYLRLDKGGQPHYEGRDDFLNLGNESEIKRNFDQFKKELFSFDKGKEMKKPNKDKVNIERD